MEIYLPIAEVAVNGLGLLVIGAMVGLVSGMFGVGGGFILTPLHHDEVMEVARRVTGEFSSLLEGIVERLR